jgi:3-methyladenine DNA glycosylase/8-oxoguanine DNA glycosylase
VPVATRTLPCPEPIDVSLTFGMLTRGRFDPTSRVDGDSFWRALNSPAGPVTFRVRVEPRAAVVTVDAWGPGQAWVVEHAAGIAGVADAPHEFRPAPGLVAALHRRLRGMRFVRMGCVLDIAVPTILEQRVTSLEARRSWQGLVRRHGTTAPGDPEQMPALLVPPLPSVLANLPDWEWRHLGVEGRRSETVRRVAVAAARLDRAAAVDITTLDRRLRAVNGVGPWTAAHVTHVVSGDADAVPTGDWHLPNHVAFALAREARADDARMLELLEPFRPYRARAWRLIVAGTHAPERRASRARIHDLMRAETRRSHAGRLSRRL